MSDQQRPSKNNPMRTVSAAQRRAERRARAAHRPASISPADPTNRQREREQALIRERKAVLDHEKVAEILHNPTKFVSEDELRGEYAYVLADIRNMFALAVGLVVVLVLLAFLLPR